MIKHYIRHVQSKSPHHRRRHSAQVAGVVTALAFVVWLTTLGFRFSVSPETTQVANSGIDQTQYAGVAGNDSAQQTGIEVVGSTQGGGSTGQDQNSTSNFSNY